MANDPMPRWRFRIRFTLRTMLVAVVVIAIFLASCKWAEKRAERLNRMATEHANKAREYAGAAWGMLRIGGFSPERETQARRYARLHELHRDFSEHCRQALWRPWVSIGNEPTSEQENEGEAPNGS